MNAYVNRIERLMGAAQSVGRKLRKAGPALLLIALAAGLVALWWFGPEWEWQRSRPLASMSSRLAATIVLVLIPVLVWTWVIRSRYRKLQADQERLKTRTDDPLRIYDDGQKRELDATLGLLRQSIGKGDWLYRLPWYVVLGQEDAGKTSFINRSNQSFALTRVIRADQRGTPDDVPFAIDWWIGNEAVLIDPAGELICQRKKSKEEAGETQPPSGQGKDKRRTKALVAEHPELPTRMWRHFVEWLGHNRSRRPLNGAILVVDLPLLLVGSASDRKALASLLRARLRDLMEQLDTRLPIYIVLSKFDLVRGFDTFFQHLPRTERERVLGFTCSLESVRDFDAWMTELTGRYDEFIAGLNEQAFDAMVSHKRLEDREDLFVFVRQLAGLKPALCTFLADVFESDRYSTPALVRGMYLTSVYQQGVPSNAFVNAAARAYGMDPEPSRALPSGKALTYFTEHLFQSVVYPEAGLAGDNLRVLRDKRKLLLANAVAAGVLGLVAIGSWQYYYVVNRNNVYRVLEKSRAFVGRTVETGTDTTGRNLLKPLDQMRDAVAVFEDYRDAWPVVADMGLYQGRVVGPKVDAVYMRLLGTRFLPELAVGVMGQLDQAAPGGNQQLAALRVYRMIEDRANRNRPVVEGWMARRWQAAFAGDGVTQDRLMRHLDYALRYVDTDLPQYRAHVEQVQAGLRQIPLAQRVYATMKDDATGMLPPPLDLRNEIGPGFDLLYQPVEATVHADGSMAPNPARIDRLFTAKGYRDYFVARRDNLIPLAMIDQWTLGLRQDLTYSQDDKRELTTSVRNLYAADYIATWRRALNSLDVTTFRDLDHAIEVLDVASGAAEPLRRLVDSVRTNTTIYDANAADKRQVAEAKAADEQDRTQARRIEREFVPLAQVLATSGDKPAYLDEANRAVLALHDFLKTVQDSPNRGQAALDAVLKRSKAGGTDPFYTLQRIANGMPEPLNVQVNRLVDESARVLMVEALHELELRWDRDVHAFYREHLAATYPFDPASRQDASLDDFEAFFGPQGRLRQFEDQYLRPYIEDSGHSGSGIGGSLLDASLQQQLQAAQRIREAFFNGRGGMGLQFNVQPLALSSLDRNSVLNVDGQLVGYAHGPSAPSGLIWPNTLRDGVESKLTLVDSGGRTRSLRFAGQWSWFRLLSQAQLNGATANSVDLSFLLGESKVRYRIVADKAVNPFTQRLFKDFALPRTLAATVDSAPVVTAVSAVVPPTGKASEKAAASTVVR
jgi:type VI secretion system protein ImpL